MTEKQFLRYWYTGLAIATGIVAAVAALLFTIIGIARSILRNAERALAVANEVVANTRPIWELEQTNTVAAELLQGAEAIRNDATAVADALETTKPAA